MRRPLALVLAALALSGAALGAGARAQVGGAEARDVVLADDQAALDALLVPEGRRSTVCTGEACPATVRRVEAEDVRVRVSGRRASFAARIRATVEVPFLGEQRTGGPVTCEGEPVLDGAGRMRLTDVTCDAGEIPGLSSVLGRYLASDLEGRSVDVAGEVRRGALARFDADPRLAAACAAACVERTELVEPLESGGHPHVVLRASLRDPACCPR